MCVCVVFVCMCVCVFVRVCVCVCVCVRARVGQSTLKATQTMQRKLALPLLKRKVGSMKGRSASYELYETYCKKYRSNGSNTDYAAQTSAASIRVGLQNHLSHAQNLANCPQPTALVEKKRNASTTPARRHQLLYYWRKTTKISTCIFRGQEIRRSNLNKKKHIKQKPWAPVSFSWIITSLYHTVEMKQMSPSQNPNYSVCVCVCVCVISMLNTEVVMHR